MSHVFLDTSFIIALNARREQGNREAQEVWSKFIAERRRFITTTFVLDEVATFFNSRGNHPLAVSTGRQILDSPVFLLVHIDAMLLGRGWEYFTRHGDKRYSLTDCISFVLMKQRGITQALTFDRHFQQAGFECLPTSDSPQS